MQPAIAATIQNACGKHVFYREMQNGHVIGLAISDCQKTQNII